MQYRKEVEREMGVELPPEGEPIPADVEKRISSLVAEAAKRVLGTSEKDAVKDFKTGIDITKELLKDSD